MEGWSPTVRALLGVVVAGAGLWLAHRIWHAGGSLA
jgi:hypothetical protein